MNTFNSSYIGLRHELIKYISKDKSNIILDVGCATGINGKYLLQEEMATAVYGIEYNTKMALKAQENGIRIFEGDLSNSNFRKTLIKEFPLFDFIIFGDVLEHLYSPEDVLSDLKQNLKDGGKIIISLPNVSHVELFIQVYVKGTWPLNNRGIFDKTHLRWFTKKDAFRLVENSGLVVEKYEPRLRARDAIGSEFNWKLKLLKALNKEWVTFQHILICGHAK